MHVDRDCYIHIISHSLMLATLDAVADPGFDLIWTLSTGGGGRKSLKVLVDG